MPKLTKRLLDGIIPDPSRELYLADDEVSGFGCRVKPSGVATFVVRYRTPGGQSRRLTLGRVGVLTVDQARSLAKLKLAEVLSGGDPTSDRRGVRQAPTVKDLCRRFEVEHIDVHLKPKTAGPYKRLMAQRIIPTFGTTKVQDVTRAEVAQWHYGLREKPVEANRSLMLLHKLFSMARLYGWREDDNPASGIQKYRETARERYLTGDELQRIGKAIHDLERRENNPLSPFLALAFRLILLTGMRKDEVLTLKWEDADLDAGVLRLPDSKTGRKTVVLSTAAVDLLRRAPKMTDSPWVVTGSSRDGNGGWPHVVNPYKAWQAVLELASTEEDKQPTVSVLDVTLHDCRHAFASIGIGAGLSLPAIGALLGHTDQASTARYAHLVADLKRQHANLIGGEIQAALDGAPGAKVFGLRARGV